jgi:protein involved in polysaccharide export with SLBB domain
MSESSREVTLFDGDTIIIPKLSNVINIIGEVLNPVAFEFNDRMRIESAINKAGGYTISADKKRVYVIKANGLVEKTGRSVFIRDYNLQPGDTIVVPRKINTNTFQGLIPVTQILSDLAFASAAIDNLSNN